MKIPRLDPVGILHVPDGYARTAAVPRHIRILAAVVLFAFVTVVVGTTAASLGQYCLTTDTANTARLDRVRDGVDGRALGPDTLGRPTPTR